MAKRKRAFWTSGLEFLNAVWELQLDCFLQCSLASHKPRSSRDFELEELTMFLKDAIGKRTKQKLEEKWGPTRGGNKMGITLRDEREG
jgi:hypothetical protein